MSNICVAGMHSSIVVALKERLASEGFIRCGWNLRAIDTRLPPLPLCERYLYAAGVIRGRKVREYDAAEAAESFAVNYWNALQFVESALAANPAARICVIGSMSAENGSYDEIYAGMKAALHLYCRTRAVRPQQQLICIAPTIIADSAMTRERVDYPRVLEERPTVTAGEVADAIVDHLYLRTCFDVQGWGSNVILHMKGRLRSAAGVLKNPPQMIADPGP